jgi:hypothetical protein
VGNDKIGSDRGAALRCVAWSGELKHFTDRVRSIPTVQAVGGQGCSLIDPCMLASGSPI